MQERASSTATDQALILLDADSLAVLQASPRAQNALGYSNAQLCQMSLPEIVLHPPPEQLRSLLLPVKDGGNVEIAVDALLREKSGREIPAALLLVRFAGPGQPRLATLIRFDSARADRGNFSPLGPRNAAFGDFASRLGHDLNNFLSTVIGSLGLIREENIAAEDHEGHRLVDDALSASRDCADLVDRLMTATGKQLLRPQRVAVNSVLRRLTPLLTQTLPDNIDLQVSLAPELPDLEVDPDRLEAAIIDLVVNAREAMPSGGELVISSGVGEAPGPGLAMESERLYVQIAVSDVGGGIPEDLHDRVLEPLFTSKPSSAGRGMGLSMVNGFVYQSHGALSIVSARGRGTRVTLHFPPAD